MDLILAKPEQAKEIHKLLTKYPVFSWLRFDALCRRINNNNCFFSDGVVITFSVYKVNRKIHDVQIHKGDVCLHQIANAIPGNGKTLPMLNAFIKEMKADIILNVRVSNLSAIRLYDKAGFKVVGRTLIGNNNYLIYKHYTHYHYVDPRQLALL